jgi:tetratricopeptide (TPR) repeat protein
MTRKMLHCITSAICALTIAGCVVSPDQRVHLIADPDDLLQDAFFTAEGESLVIEAEADLFELPESYKRQLDRALLSAETEWDRYRAVRRWIFRNFEDYDFDVTETSSLLELSTNRKINCLSFSVLFVAAARYADVDAEFQLVFAPPYWDKEGNSWVNNQHINVTGVVRRPLDDGEVDSFFTSSRLETWGPLTLKRSGFGSFLPYRSSQRYTVDINPAITNIPIRRQLIDEQQVLSLYHSNKSMQFLFNRDLLNAYSHTKQALLVDPDSVVAWNNLGVLYARVAQPALAIAAYQRAIFLDASIYSAKINLANTYRSQGEVKLADELDDQLESYRNQNPYYHSAQAEVSIDAGEYEQAIIQLQAAVARKPNEHYFYHQLAVANQQLGNMDAVVENLVKARRYARGTEKARFSGKVKALEAVLAGND